RLLLLQRAVLHHTAQDELASPFGRVGVVERRVARWRARQPGEERGLARGQLGHRLAEVRSRRRFDTVRAVAEVPRVPVHLEDAILGVTALGLTLRYGSSVE